MADSSRREERPYDDAEPFARMVVEALDRLASPAIRDAIVTQSLRAAGLASFPSDPVSFGNFACNEFREAVVDRLGDEAASAVLTDLSPALTHDAEAPSSGVRRRKPHSLPAPEVGAPVILVASSSMEDVSNVTSALAKRAKVVAAYDVYGLIQNASRYSGQALAVLVHDDLPALQADTLRTVGSLLGDATHVLRWGPRALRPDADHLGAQHCGAVTAEEVASVAADLLKPRSRSTRPPAGARKKRVMVVEPATDFRAYLATRLRLTGYEVIESSDGFEALDRCLDQLPDAVVAGHQLGSLDGTQLSVLLETRFQGESPPVLMLAEPPLPPPPNETTVVLRRSEPAESVLSELAARLR